MEKAGIAGELKHWPAQLTLVILFCIGLFTAPWQFSSQDTISLNKELLKGVEKFSELVSLLTVG